VVVHNAIAGKRAALGLAALRTMAEHNVSNRAADFKPDNATKAAACIHNKDLMPEIVSIGY
jgi:hypothetical protein